MSTIAAVATGPAPGGVGIIRLSGPEAVRAARQVAPGLPAQLRPRFAHLARFVDRSGALLDEGLILHFPAPASYTGEDVVELHAHGSPRLLSLLLGELLATGHARLAGPGEFTRRAWLNGRVALQAAEGVADLVAADSEAAVRAAAAQVAGALSAQLGPVVDGLRALHADVEAVLSFPDESEGAEEGLCRRLAQVHGGVAQLCERARQGRVVRRGARVVLVGPPNAGKSTLFNRMLGEERALVDEAPGTTRDALEARLELGGLSVTLVDTAGLREAPGRVEALGVQRARAEVAAADLVLLVLPPGEDAGGWRGELGAAAPVVEVRSKRDLAAAGPGSGGAAWVSGLSGEGVAGLLEQVRVRLTGYGTAGAVSITGERHAECLFRAAQALDRAREAHVVSTLEVVAGELGLALAALLDITGEDASEALLDEVFRRFCIGK
ncbi:MAG: tRNA uridine-5-carboxymethylaminomethyl(34) synthesis GTPase MnmE [Deltaproteobacteria bacterium]|nr:tRNA uridine-5-carboxymethylaminomethyl(34) synthesis GTPase MnmE [Deltaproteobacteria bacterium]